VATLNTRHWRCDGDFNGRSEAADFNGHRRCVRVLIPANPSRERSGGIKFRCRCSAAPNTEASGLASEVLYRADGGPGAETSARNRLSGTVLGVEKQERLARVSVDVGADRPLTALLTVGSCERLGITSGTAVVAPFKTTATRVTPQP